MKSYSRVTYEVRCQIAALLKINLSIPEIATQLGFHKSTIYREIGRNSIQSSSQYYPITAEKRSIQRGMSRARKKVIFGELKYFVGQKLIQGWSPEQIAGRYKKESSKSLCHQTIYRFIKSNPEYKQYLRFCNKRGCGRTHQRRIREERLKSIHTRPISAKNRSRFGHWERDGMYGANRQQILVCLERKSRMIRLARMNSSNSSEVSLLTEKLLQKEKVITLTNDNGTEFRRPESCKYPIYYCDPMRPDQRGSVENVIGTLRKYVKRNTDLEKLGNKEIKRLEKHLNYTPRKIFNYQTPYEVYYKTKVALVM